MIFLFLHSINLGLYGVQRQGLGRDYLYIIAAASPTRISNHDLGGRNQIPAAEPQPGWTFGLLPIVQALAPLGYAPWVQVMVIPATRATPLDSIALVAVTRNARREV